MECGEAAAVFGEDNVAQPRITEFFRPLSPEEATLQSQRLSSSVCTGPRSRPCAKRPVGRPRKEGLFLAAQARRRQAVEEGAHSSLGSEGSPLQFDVSDCDENTDPNGKHATQAVDQPASTDKAGSSAAVCSRTMGTNSGKRRYGTHSTNCSEGIGFVRGINFLWQLFELQTLRE